MAKRRMWAEWEEFLRWAKPRGGKFSAKQRAARREHIAMILHAFLMPGGVESFVALQREGIAKWNCSLAEASDILFLIRKAIQRKADMRLDKTREAFPLPEYDYDSDEQDDAAYSRALRIQDRALEKTLASVLNAIGPGPQLPPIVIAVTLPKKLPRGYANTLRGEECALIDVFDALVEWPYQVTWRRR